MEAFHDVTNAFCVWYFPKSNQRGSQTIYFDFASGLKLTKTLFISLWAVITHLHSCSVPDSDNDGIPDHQEDSDGDGIPDAIDNDSDNDGIQDNQ